MMSPPNQTLDAGTKKPGRVAARTGLKGNTNERLQRVHRAVN
jgi:hypothetical protein